MHESKISKSGAHPDFPVCVHGLWWLPHGAQLVRVVSMSERNTVRVPTRVGEAFPGTHVSVDASRTFFYPNRVTVGANDQILENSPTKLVSYIK